MWCSSSSTRENRRRRPCLFLPSSTARLSLHQLLFFAQGRQAHHRISSSSGKDSQTQMLPGSRWNSSRRLFLISSLRSCFLTGREVLWTDYSVTSSSDVTRSRLLLVARTLYILMAVIYIMSKLHSGYLNYWAIPRLVLEQKTITF